MPRSHDGYYLLTWGGDRYTSIMWTLSREEAEAAQDRLLKIGAWRGMPPVVESARRTDG